VRTNSFDNKLYFLRAETTHFDAYIDPKQCHYYDSHDILCFRYYGEMPWLALPFAQRELKQKLSTKFGVSGIPSLVLISADGQLVSEKGREIVSEDPKGEKFPWQQKALDSFDAFAEALLPKELDMMDGGVRQTRRFWLRNKRFRFLN
jgi:hypothetical protein